jgi:hypothetical protein
MRRTNRKTASSDRNGTGPTVPPTTDGAMLTLPLVIATADQSGRLSILVDGEPHGGGPVRRETLGQVLASIAADREGPIRVEVREADGTRFVDLLTPPPPPSRFAPTSEPAPVQPTPALFEVLGEGFVPGEDVAIALVRRHASARSDGTARALVDRIEAPDGPTGVILFGLVSGTLFRPEPR